jgi:hypothetical protein
MVWQMIELGVFGKTENDSRADFNGVFDFKTAFVEPFLPAVVPVRSVIVTPDTASPSKQAAA